MTNSTKTDFVVDLDLAKTYHDNFPVLPAKEAVLYIIRFGKYISWQSYCVTCKRSCFTCNQIGQIHFLAVLLCHMQDKLFYM